MKKVTFIAALITPFVIALGYIVNIILFEINCTDYLKRTADANTIELAVDNLKMALDYLEENNLTSGYTSVLYKTPDEDITYWYNNLKNSYIELVELDPNTTSLEKSNMLMKLRETILDSGEHGEYVTCPPGICRYPHNLGWGILMCFGIAVFFIGIGLISHY